jgi:hypothetical protein
LSEIPNGQDLDPAILLDDPDVHGKGRHDDDPLAGLARFALAIGVGAERPVDRVNGGRYRVPMGASTQMVASCPLAGMLQNTSNIKDS